MSDNKPAHVVLVDPQAYGLGMALGCLVKFWPVLAVIGAILFGIIFLYNVFFVYPVNARKASQTAVALDQLAMDRETEYNHCIQESTNRLQANSMDVEAYFQRGRCYEEIEWYLFNKEFSDIELRSSLEAALADYNRIIEIDPTDIKVYVYKGLVCERLGLSRDALEAYKIWVANPPPDTYQQSLDAVWERINQLEAAVVPPTGIPESSPLPDWLHDSDIVALKCLGTIEGPRWLDGRTSDGTVGLTLTPEGYSGARWQIHIIEDSIIALENMGNIEGPKWLDGRTGDGSVGLASEIDGYSGTLWRVYTIEEGIITLENMGDIDGSRWLDGRTGNGSVGLAPQSNDTYSGTRWQIVLNDNPSSETEGNP